MRAWYDILALDRSVAEDESGIRESANAVDRLVNREVERGLVEARVVVAGFSQGGAVVLHAGLRHPKPLGGILALSTYLPLAEQCAAEVSENARELPIWMGHGTYDPVIDIALAERSRDWLVQAGMQVEWHSYPMQHSVSAQEIADISEWLARFA